MLDRHDLTDEEWARLEPWLPDRTPRRGGRWADHRMVINGVLWRTRTGSPWRDLPGCYGTWKTVYNRHHRWSHDGTWAGCCASCAAAGTPRTGTGRGRWGWTPPWCGPTSTPPVPAVTDRRRPRRPAMSGRAESNHKNSAADSSDNSPDSVGDGRHADREGLGRSRGGLNTKLHLAADSRCRPISRVITAGQRHDAVAFEQVMAGIAIDRAGRGRPRTRPDRVLADKAHSSKAIRAHLRRRGIKATIPEPANQQTHRARRGARGGRPPELRPARLPQAQHRRTHHQQAQALPGGGHPLRQARGHVPGRHRRGHHQNLAPPPPSMIHGTRPKSISCPLVIFRPAGTRSGPSRSRTGCRPPEAQAAGVAVESGGRCTRRALPG